MKTVETVQKVVIVVLMLSMVIPVYAAEQRHTAQVISVKGDVMVQRGGKGKWIPAAEGMTLNQEDAIWVKDDSEARIELGGLKGEKATVDLEEDTNLTLVELVKDEEAQTQSTLLDLAIGKVLIKAKKLRREESKFEVKTPTSITGIRGTEFSVEVEAID